MSIASRENIRIVADAMFGVLKPGGAKLAAYAQAEAAKFMHSMEQIAELVASGVITEEEAQLQLDIQKQASLTVLSAAKGISLIVAARALNAGMAAAAGIVNTAIGFNLLPTGSS